MSCSASRFFWLGMIFLVLLLEFLGEIATVIVPEFWAGKGLVKV